MGLGSTSIRKSYYPELQNTIDELKKEKEYISDIINSMPSILISINKEGIVNRWNNRATEIFGYSEEEVVGKKLSLVLPYLQEEIEQACQTASTINQNQRVRKRRLKGENPIYEDISLYRLSGSRGNEDIVLKIDDVTEQVRLQETMVQSEKMLSIGGLAAGMAHEINNPLAGILQTAEVLEKRLTDTELPANRKAARNAGISLEALKIYFEDRGIGKMLLAINESGKRASGIIRNMLRFSRRDDDSHAYHNPAHLLDLILELAATDFNIKSHYDFKHINILKEYADNLPPVPCSESQIQQVILNLLRNGAEAMSEIQNDEYTPRFILRLLKEQAMLRIEIEDNGPGIAAENQQRIFEPFYSTKPVGIGTGLGLSVSHFIIENNHKGTMNVETAEEGGARFVIRLPLKR